MKWYIWVLYWLMQLFMVTMGKIVGLLLIFPCLFQAWEISDKPSINDGRKIDKWTWTPLNWIWGNPEDGVSGQTALVWINGVTRVEYWRTCPANWIRAMAWSWWRNGADQLKYWFQWRGTNPPLVEGSFHALGRDWNYSFGWKLENTKYQVPVVGCKPAASSGASS